MIGHLTDSLRADGARPTRFLVLGATLLFGWWAWKQGAYFDGVFYPGAIGLLVLCALLLAWAPFKGDLKGPAGVALAALVLLAAWTALSAIWSDVPAAGPTYAARVVAYAALFLFGVWLVLLLRQRMTDALLPLALAGGVIGLATTITLVTGDDSSWYLHEDATLRFPIGYRNANAAFLMVCIWPMIALASDNSRHWLGRALAIAAATGMIELAILAQSRGSLPATLVAVTVFIAVMPYRLRAASMLAIAALPAALALPTLLEVYRYGDDGPGALGPLQDAARAIILTSLLSLAIACFVLVVVYPRLNLGRRRIKLIGQITTVVALLVAVIGASAFVARHGGPIAFVDQRVEEFTSIGYPDLHEQGIRYGANVGSNRADFWRVSLETWRDSPLLGAGAGSFEPAYLKLRRSVETPQDPHSVEMLMLSEQGLVGLVLLLTFLVAAGIGALRARWLGERAALLSAAALAAAAQWVIPASYDWFWQYAGITAPAIFLLGAAAAPAMINPEGRLSAPLRIGGTALCVLLAIAIVPAYLSDRYFSRAIDLEATDTAAALADYRRAAKLAPLDPEPDIAAGRVELEAGRPRLAVIRGRRALEREPISYAANLLLAEAMIAVADPTAKAQVSRLRELSPIAPEIDRLAREAAELESE